jgi:hypothetical protein
MAFANLGFAANEVEDHARATTKKIHRRQVAKSIVRTWSA